MSAFCPGSVPVYTGSQRYIGEILTMRPRAEELEEMRAAGMTIEECGDGGLWQVVAIEGSVSPWWSV